MELTNYTPEEQEKIDKAVTNLNDSIFKLLQGRFNNEKLRASLDVATVAFYDILRIVRG